MYLDFDIGPDFADFVEWLVSIWIVEVCPNTELVEYIRNKMDILLDANREKFGRTAGPLRFIHSKVWHQSPQIRRALTREWDNWNRRLAAKRLNLLCKIETLEKELELHRQNHAKPRAANKNVRCNT